MTTPEGSHLEIVFDHEGTVKSSEETDQDEEANLEEMPIAIIWHLEQDQLSGTKRIHGLEISHPTPSCQWLDFIHRFFLCVFQDKKEEWVRNEELYR